MINENGETMVEHHVKYLELHGLDETKWMTRSEHNRLHHRLRKEGKCNVPVNELIKISSVAHNRTQKAIKYRQSDKRKKQKTINRQAVQNIDFYESPLPNIRFHERISYNHRIGTVCYSSCFYPGSGHFLPYIDIESKRVA